MSLRVSLTKEAFTECHHEGCFHSCGQLESIAVEATVDVADWAVYDVVITPERSLAPNDMENVLDELRDVAERIACLCSRCEQGPCVSSICSNCRDHEMMDRP